MVRIEKERYVDGNYNAVLDLQVSTAAELPDMGGTIGLYTVAPGSIAQIVQANSPTFVTLDDDGTWYPEQSDSSASTLNASLSAPKTSAQLGEGKSVLVQDEPEINLDGGFEREEQPVKEQKKPFVESVEEPEQDGDDDERELL
jgi:hypothetical protein